MTNKKTESDHSTCNAVVMPRSSADQRKLLESYHFRQGEVGNGPKITCKDCNKPCNGQRGWWRRISYEYNQWDCKCRTCALGYCEREEYQRVNECSGSHPCYAITESDALVWQAKVARMTDAELESFVRLLHPSCENVRVCRESEVLPVVTFVDDTLMCSIHLCDPPNWLVLRVMLSA